MKYIFHIIKLQTSWHIIAITLTISIYFHRTEESQSGSIFLLCIPKTVILFFPDLAAPFALKYTLKL